MRLRNPGDIDGAIRMLDDLTGQLMHCRGYDDTVQYLAWCDEASRRLRERFVTPELAELAERDQRDLTLGGAVMTHRHLAGASGGRESAPDGPQAVH